MTFYKDLKEKFSVANNARPCWKFDQAWAGDPSSRFRFHKNNVECKPTFEDYDILA